MALQDTLSKKGGLVLKKVCQLIATLPSLATIAFPVSENQVIRTFAEPNISEVRFNTGARSPFTPEETIQRLSYLSQQYGKKLWIDLKGRQLRIIEWADTLYEAIKLNHSFEVELPARIVFRNDTSATIASFDGNSLFISKPHRVVGKGQSVNILGKNLHITDGYLTALDKEYISALRNIPLPEVNIMASFVESKEDIEEIANLRGDPEHKATYCAKIESQNGMDFVYSQPFVSPYHFMAARDDLFIELEGNYPRMKNALITISKCDKEAICASRIFTSLVDNDAPSLADFEDLEWMYKIGYRRFMLSDSVCNYAFEKAMKAWEGFIDA